MSGTPARRGRPPRDNPRDATWTLRATETELEAIGEAAARAGVTRAEWVRKTLADAASAGHPLGTVEEVMRYATGMDIAGRLRLLEVLAREDQRLRVMIAAAWAIDPDAVMIAAEVSATTPDSVKR